jgi:tRNA-Thr(GGU) m(6)t(6)A37 methyltransferase TsaA
MESQLVMSPIGVVHGTRKEPIDDHWSGERAEIELDAQQFSDESLAGLSSFSHVQVIYLMHGVEPADVETGARHPRNRADWPKVGIFAQRAKRRPNRIGLSCCRVLGIDGLRIRVEGLDAIDGTPVLDIKPWVREFGPRGEVAQPDWMTEIMTEYY